MFLQPNLILSLALVAATQAPAQQGGDSPIQLDLEQRPAARRTAIERADWSDEAFRRRFRLSNLSETDIEPTLREEERELVIEAIALMQDEKVDEALELVQASVGEETGPVVHFTLGNLSYRKEQFGFAAQHYEKAIELFPRYRRAWTMLGEVRYQMNDLPGAIEAFAQVISSGGGDAQMHGLLGVCHKRMGSAVAAETAFRTAMMLAPNAVEWKVHLGDSLFQQARYADAAAIFQSLIQQDPDNAALWMAQGKAFAMTGDVIRAAQNFEVVDLLGGADANMLANLGRIYANQKLFDPAVDAFTRAMAKSAADQCRSFLEAARYLSFHGGVEATRRLLSAIEKEFGDEMDAKDQKALLQARVLVARADGLTDEEIDLLRELVRLDPLDGQALIQLGMHFSRRDDAASAELYLERAKKLEAFRTQATLALGEHKARAGDHAGALTEFRAAYKDKPTNHIRDYIEYLERLVKRR